VALPLVRALQQFEREGFAGFASAYARRDLLLGQRVSAVDTAAAGRADGTVEGMADGVSAQGALRLRTDDGAVREIGSGEVSVRLTPASGN
jgi:BirA family biotin operon repressor/biotin-[acetyl-CoA-carboxylase] ligase